MPTCRDIDAQIVDLLYGELDSPVEASFREHLASCATCTTQLASFAWVRDLMRELPVEEAPIAVSNIVLHEAGKRAAGKKTDTDEQPAGLWAWLASLLQTFSAHPAMAAVASLVLVATVGGVMYARSGSQVAEPVILAEDGQLTGRFAEPPPPPSAGLPTGESAIAQGTVDEQQNTWAQNQQEGFTVDLASAGDLADSGNAWSDDNAAPPADGVPGRAAQPAPDKDVETAERIQAGLVDKRPRNSKKGKVAAERTVSTDEDRDDDFMGTGSIGSPPEEAKKAASPGGEKSDQKRSQRAAGPMPKPDSRPAIAAPAPLESAPLANIRSASTPTPPPAQAKNEAREQNEKTRTNTNKDSGKSTWAAAQHEQLKQALTSKQCSRVATIANDLRDRDRKYYNANVNATALKPCYPQIASEQSRRSRMRKAKAKRAAKQAKDQAVEAEAADAAE